MIKIQKNSFSFSGNKITESIITAEEACHILHSLSPYERAGSKIVYESDEDKKQLVRTYYDMYHNGFNIRHNISDEEQTHLQVAYPAETDVFYVENIMFRFEAGIRALDPRYARVNTHETNFTFQVTPIFKCIAINSASDEEAKVRWRYFQEYIIYKHEELNHLSYEDAQKYIEYVWSAYQDFFTDSLEFPELDKIIAVNKNFGLPWYKRL